MGLFGGKGTKPGVILFYLNYATPDQKDMPMLIQLYTNFVKSSGNTYLQELKAEVVISFMGRATNDDAVIDEYQKSASQRGWKTVRPKVQLVVIDGESKYAIAYPEKKALK